MKNVKNKAQLIENNIPNRAGHKMIYLTDIEKKVQESSNQQIKT